MKNILLLIKRMAVCHPFLILTFFTVNLNSYAQGLDNKILNKAFNESIHLRVESSKALTQLCKENSAFKLLIDDYNDCLTIILTEDQDNSKAVLDRSNQRIKTIETSSISESYKVFFISEILLHQSLVNFMFNYKLDGLLKLKSAYNKTENNLRRYPNFALSKKTKAYLDLILGSTPNDLRWFLKKFGLKGDFHAGLQAIRVIAQSNSIFANEAIFLDVIASSYVIENFAYSRHLINKTLVQDPKSLSAHLISSLIFLKQNDNNKTFLALQKIPTGPSYAKIPMIDFLKGESNLFKGNYNQAALHYYAFALSHKGKNLIKTTYYRLFQCHMLLGNENRAYEFLKNCIGYGSDLLESDKYAQFFAEKLQIPCIELIKVRLLTDGGYTDKALAEINKIRPSNLSTKYDSTEYQYRYARIYHLNKDYSKAKEHYIATIELQTWDQDYFAPNACLQLGYIYQSESHVSLAIEYFKKAQTYHNHPYEESITRKARSEIRKSK